MLSIQLSSNLKLCHRGRPLPTCPLGFVSFTTAALINHEILRFLSSLSFHVVIDSIIHSSRAWIALPAIARVRRNYGRCLDYRHFECKYKIRAAVSRPTFLQLVLREGRNSRASYPNLHAKVRARSRRDTRPASSSNRGWFRKSRFRNFIINLVKLNEGKLSGRVGMSPARSLKLLISNLISFALRS